jgi:hydrogenase maturation protease
MIVAIGDARRRDDAVGIAVAEELRDSLLPEDVRVEIAHTEGFDLVAAIAGAQRAIILAAIALGEKPGTVHVLTPADAEARADYVSGLGEMSLIDLLELAALRGGPEVLLIGIEPAEIVPGQTLHPSVATSVGEAAQLARDIAAGRQDWRLFAGG